MTVHNVRIGVLDNDACAMQYITLMLNQLNHRNGLELSLWSTVPDASHTGMPVR